MIKKIDWVVGIDPDVDKNGVAFLDCATKRLKIMTYAFADTLDYLRRVKREAEVTNMHLMVVIEAGWLNKTHWHITPRDTKQSAAAKGNHVGRNHETGRKLAEMCEYFGIPYKLQKPLALKSGGLHLWKSKDGKITHDELASFTGITGRTNQEGRDAALIAWVSAGFPIRL
jgi:hypothetical protein